MSKHGIALVSPLAVAVLLLGGPMVMSARGQEPPPEIRAEIAKVRAELERNRAVQAELEARLRRLTAQAEAAAAAQRQGKDGGRALRELLKERERNILELETRVKAQQHEMVQQRIRAETLQRRNEQLTNEVQKLTGELLRLKGRREPAPVEPRRDGPNPPPNKVKGTIVEVSPRETGLVTLSVGAEDGLQTGHTLEVYRLKPEPKYLGRLRVVSVQPRRAAARLEDARTRARVTLRPGDAVASELK